MDSDTVAAPARAEAPLRAHLEGTVALVRSSVRDEPTSGPGDFATTLAILDRVDRLKELGDTLLRLVEQESGLRRSELALLDSLSTTERSGDAHANHPRRLGRDVGMTTEAVVATAHSLASRGLVAVVHDAAGRPASIDLTDAGMAVLTQAEAVQIRATDAAVREVGPEQSQRALRVLDQIIGAMSPITPGAPLPAGAGELRLLPGA